MYHLQLTIHKKKNKKNARPLTLYPELNMKIVVKFQTFFVHKYIFLSNYILGLSFNYFDHNDVKCFVWGTQHVWNFHKKTYMYWFDNFRYFFKSFEIASTNRVKSYFNVQNQPRILNLWRTWSIQTQTRESSTSVYEELSI